MDIATALSMSEAGIALFDANGMVVFANDAWRELISTVPDDRLQLVETHLPDGYVVAVCVHGSSRNVIAEVQPPTPAPPPKRHLLLAEDSGTNQIVARTMLERAGYEVSCVEDGIAAVEAASTTVFDLILMDVAMPGMNGMEATSTIRNLPNQSAQTPILALTAHALGASRKECLEAGMDDYLSKPFDRRELVEHIEALLVGRDYANQPADRALPPTGHPQKSRIKSLLDHDILKQLLVDAGMEGARIGIEIYLEEAERRLSDIKLALADRNYDSIGRQAHSLKSASGTFGLVQLQDHCSQLQTAHEQKDNEGVRQLAISLPEVAEPSLAELGDYFAQLSAAMTS